MEQAEQLEILRGVLAVAIADGGVARSEKGVIASLAKKVGVDPGWLDEMAEQARVGASVESTMFRPVLDDPVRALTLLVGTAAIDGEISEEEKSVLVDISLRLRLPPGKFGQVFQEGLETAKRLRKNRDKIREP